MVLFLTQISVPSRELRIIYRDLWMCQKEINLNLKYSRVHFEWVHSANLNQICMKPKPGSPPTAKAAPPPQCSCCALHSLCLMCLQPKSEHWFWLLCQTPVTRCGKSTRLINIIRAGSVRTEITNCLSQYWAGKEWLRSVWGGPKFGTQPLVKSSLASFEEETSSEMR